MTMFKNRLLSVLIVTGVLGLLSCVSVPPLKTTGPAPVAQPAPAARKTLLRSEPQEKPGWVATVPKSDTELFFVGTSLEYDTVARARDAARENAFNQVLKFYGEFIQAQSSNASSFTGSSSDTIATLIKNEEEIMRFAQAVVSQVGADKYYTEVYLDEANKEGYVVYTLCQIPRQKAEQDIAEFAQKTSEQYGNLLATHSTVSATLHAYGAILAALTKNPLHRAVAWYDSPKGRVNMYDYLTVQINTLANSIAIAPIVQAVVRKTDTLNTTVKVASSEQETIGSLECLVSIFGMNNTAPTVKYTVTADNSFAVQIYTAKLEPGRYTVTLELLLKDISAQIGKNIQGGFSFEVTPISASCTVDFTGDEIDKFGINEQSYAKEKVSNSIQKGLNDNKIPISIMENGNDIFAVKVDMTNTSSGNIRADVNIKLLHNGHPVGDQLEFVKADTDIKLLFDRRVSDYISANKEFYDSINEALNVPAK
jgi:hypothetical protein